MSGEVSVEGGTGVPLGVAVGRALHAAVAEHMTITETEGGFFECGEGMFGAYHWCVCGWRSDDGPWPDRETYIRGCGQALITHLGNAMFAAVRDLLPTAPTGGQVGSAFIAWAAKNEIAEPPLDWAWFGEVARWSGASEYEGNA